MCTLVRLAVELSETFQEKYLLSGSLQSFSSQLFAHVKPHCENSVSWAFESPSWTYHVTPLPSGLAYASQSN